jgi:CubicO group peptidase (beta-lactamase class C family)
MNGRRWFSPTLGLLLFHSTIGSSALRAQQTGTPIQASERYSAAVEFANTLMAAVLERSGTHGMSVAVGVSGRVVWTGGFGYADVEERVPVSEQTKFRVGSISKPLTAAAIGLLVEQGKLDLDAPVQRYVPSFPKKRWAITTRQLAGHLAGIRHYNGDAEIYSSRHYGSVLEGLEIFRNDRLLFQPGTDYAYSTYGWSLISAVLEGASGADFLSLMKDEVFDALGMAHTEADRADQFIPLRTRFYDRSDDGVVVEAPYVDNSYKWAGGGFLSTPRDLVRFGLAHLSDDLLQPETVRMLWTPQATSSGESTDYGIGWKVIVDSTGVIQAAHDGSSIGGTAILVVRPQPRAAMAILGNMTQAPTGGELPFRILDAFLDAETIISDDEGPDIAGTYHCAATILRDVEIARGTLELSGSPAEYTGTMTWGAAEPSRIIHSLSDPERTELVTVNRLGELVSLRFSSLAPDSLRGTWSKGGGGGLACRRAGSGVNGDRK